MKTMEIVFTASKKKLPLLSWAIRLWTWKPYSHVARRSKISFAEKHHYFHANEGKVNYEYETHFFKKHKIIKKYELTVPQKFYYEMAKQSWVEAGAKYGYLQHIGIAIVDVAKLLGFKICNPWKQGRNCSELLYITILKPMFPDLEYDPETIKPHHIERILIEKGFKHGE